MSSFSKKGLKQSVREEKKSIRLHLNAIYNILKKLDIISNEIANKYKDKEISIKDIDKEIENYKDVNIQSHERYRILFNLYTKGRIGEEIFAEEQKLLTSDQKILSSEEKRFHK